MILTPALRHEAEAEARRLWAVRAGPAVTQPTTAPGDVGAATLRTSPHNLLHDTAAIFFVRVRIIDGSGRLLEDVMLPVQLRLPLADRATRRSDVRDKAQLLIVRHGPAAMAAAGTHLAVRLAEISRQYGRGLERAERRERWLGRIVNHDGHHLVQAGLFDRRALKNLDAARYRVLRASRDSHERRQTLQSVMAGLSTLQPEIVLLLLIETTA
jgi:hypothetical protein